jgi:hypothetical protein
MSYWIIPHFNGDETELLWSLKVNNIICVGSLTVCSPGPFYYDIQTHTMYVMCLMNRNNNLSRTTPKNYSN